MSVDLSVIGSATRQGLRSVEARLLPHDGRSAKVSGLAKLAQTVIFLFTTRQGSVALWPEIGASPLDELRQTLAGEREEIDNRLANAASNIISQVASMQAPGTPDDERIDDLTITSDVSDGSDKLDITIRLRSVAGDAAEYTTPIGLVQ